MSEVTEMLGVLENLGDAGSFMSFRMSSRFWSGLIFTDLPVSPTIRNATRSWPYLVLPISRRLSSGSMTFPDISRVTVPSGFTL